MIKRIDFALAAIAALALVLAATPHAMAQALKVGAASNPGGLVVFVAQQKGFFANNGIDVRVEIRNTGSELSKGLRAGEFDFAPAAFTNLPAALERGFEARAVVGYVGAAYVSDTSDDQVGIVVRGDSGIESVADLKGKKIGVTFGSTGDVYLQEALKEAGLSVNDVDRVNTRPPGLTSVIDTGGVDAVSAWEPVLYRVANKVAGSKLIKRGGGHVCFCAYLHGKPETVYGNEEATQKLVDAMAEAAAFVRDPNNREEVAEIGSRFANLTKEEILATLEHWSYDPRIGENTARAFNNSVELLIAQKKMKKPYDPANYLESKFIESTMERHPEWFADLGGAS